MSKGDNACIRYLMKEMDPSEELVFENEMLEDENLLIEVESLRSINRKLSDLPVMNPPKAVTSELLSEVSLRIKEKHNRRQIKYTIMSAAATVLIVVLAGSWMMISDDFAGSNSTASQAGASLPEFGYLNSSESGAEAGVSPWVDRNQVLEFSSQSEAISVATFDSMYRSSYEKLEPLEQADGFVNDQLQLTGSQ